LKKLLPAWREARLCETSIRAMFLVSVNYIKREGVCLAVGLGKGEGRKRK
jgi:hypothetical protein